MLVVLNQREIYFFHIQVSQISQKTAVADSFDGVFGNVYHFLVARAFCKSRFFRVGVEFSVFGYHAVHHDHKRLGQINFLFVFDGGFRQHRVGKIFERFFVDFNRRYRVAADRRLIRRVGLFGFGLVF